jgi:hypothetical protein
MSKDIRHVLESIAVDKVMLSMEHIGEECDPWSEVAELTDDELIEFVCE